MNDIAIMILSLFIIITSYALVTNKDKYAKFLILNHLHNMIILFVVFLSIFKFNEFYIDVALTYSFLGFIFTQAVLRFYSSR